MMLAESGARVAVSDINAESADETVRKIAAAGGLAKPFKLDVSDYGQIKRVARLIEAELGIPSILVNNAGIAVGGNFVDSSEESWSRVVSVNLMGVVNCSRVFIAPMIASGMQGHVVNVASMLGYTAARGVSAYCATKFGVVGFSECLRAELSGQKIGVSVICPGMVRTNIISSGILESEEADVEEKRKTIEDFYERRNYPPERVARAISRAIRKNRALVPVTPEAWLSWYLKRLSPALARLIALRELV